MNGVIRVAYLAPEIPALSATFVYEEILGLVRRGVNVIPFSVHKPINPAVGLDTLAGRVTVLYGRSAYWQAMEGLFLLPSLGRKSVGALNWLFSDIRECGWNWVISWKLAYQFLAAVRLARSLKQHHCSHLHIHFAHVPTQIGMYAAKLCGIPFTVTAHANDIFERGLLLKRKAERAMRFLTISEYNLRFLESQGIPSDQLAIVRCGVSLAPESRPNSNVNIGGIFRIGSLGRLVEKKGFDVLLRAVGLLHQRGLAVQLDVAGDGPLRAELQALAYELNIEQLTTFVGSLPHFRVGTWMKELNVFSLACKRDQAGDMDGIPVVLMEAMSQGLPVISTRISGIPELIIHEETGLLAQPNDAEDLALQLERLITSPQLALEMATKALDHVEVEFSQSVNLERLIHHFELSHKKLAPER